jgi:hypothetical protein
VRFDRDAVADAEPHWAMLQEAGFGGEHPPGFVAGVLRKFIWRNHSHPPGQETGTAVGMGG